MSKKKRTYLLERVDDTDVVQLYCDDFANLDPNDKMLGYFLSLAAREGRAIAIDQSSPFASGLKQLLEKMLTHNLVKDAADLEKIRDYMKKFWISQGPYHHASGKKILLDIPADKFQRMIYGLVPHPEYWTAAVCDPTFQSSNCNKSAQDIIAESHNNFYHGVAFSEVDAWAKENERYPLNSTVEKIGSRITESVWRAGVGNVPPGLYAMQLTWIVAHLLTAVKYAAPQQQKAITALAEFFQTGDPKLFDRFNIEWVSYDTPVDFILGFIETYLDPRGMKGSFEGIVHAVDSEATAIMGKLGSEAAYFESRMPWNDKYKNLNAKPLPFRVVNTIFACGNAGPIMPIGINLPNDNQIREKYGSKSVMLKNIMGTYRETSGTTMLREFAWDEEEVALAGKYGDLEDDLHVAMHEVLGHASGKMARAEDPNKLLPGCYSTLEEGRADLIALWLIFDPKLKELGLVPNDDVGRAAYQHYVRNGGLMQLRRVTEGDKLEEPHMQNRQLIVRYVMENSDAVSVRARNSKTYFVVTDFVKMREKIGELLAEIMRIKAEGDFPAAKALVERYATKVDAKLRDEVVRRAKALDIPNYTAFVMPEPKLVYRNGVPDIKLTYPMNITKQMLNW